MHLVIQTQLILFIFNCIQFCNSYYNQDVIEKVKITVFYEALCPYSREWFVNQLYPTYEKLKVILDVELVPYGLAKVNGSEVRCHHGFQECKLHKIHACIMNQRSGKLGSRLKMIECLMQQQNNFEECVDNWVEINRCASGFMGMKYSRDMRRKTKLANITFVPTVFFNDEMDFDLDHRAVDNLLEVVCGLLKNPPESCEETIKQ